MATSINFPISPTQGQLYTYGATTYVWEGTRWTTKLQITDDVISGSLRVTNGITGSLFGTASYAVTASYATNAGVTVTTGSLLLTASAALNVITFTKGDGTTFPVTVNTGSGGGVTGTGTTNYVPKFTGTSAIGNSLIYDNGTTISVNTTAPTSGYKFEVSGSDIQVNGIRIGIGAGNKDTNAAFGIGALLQNTTGFSNTAIGNQTLSGNIGGFGHIAVGGLALSTVTGGYYNIGLGWNSQTLTATDTYSIVIGSGATGLGTNTTVIGYSGTTLTAIYGNVALGKTTATAKLDINGSAIISGTVTAGIVSATTYQNLPFKYYAESSTAPATLPTVTAANSVAFGSAAEAKSTHMFVFGASAGGLATGANNSNFFGQFAGQYATNANNSNFFGNSAGYSATNANNAIFMGVNTGNGATGANQSIFMGSSTGMNATGASYSNFIGSGAGRNSSNGQYSNFMGNSAGYGATNASQSNFIGRLTGYNATSASNSTLIGTFVGRADVLASIGSNNIIIGTNISLPGATANSINLGGVLFGTGTYSTITGNPSTVPNNGKIGINVLSPTEALHVVGNATITGSLTVSGSIAMPSRPAFRVTGADSTDITAITVLSGSAVTVDYNQGSYYSNTNGTFTAPRAGLYSVYMNVRCGSANSQQQVILLKNSTTSSLMWESATNTGATHFGVSGVLNLALNDTLKVQVQVGSIQFDGNNSWGAVYIG